MIGRFLIVIAEHADAHHLVCCSELASEAYESADDANDEKGS